MSVLFTPAAPTSISTSPTAGLGIGTSSRYSSFSGPPWPVSRTAFMSLTRPPDCPLRGDRRSVLRLPLDAKPSDAPHSLNCLFAEETCQFGGHPLRGFLHQEMSGPRDDRERRVRDVVPEPFRVRHRLPLVLLAPENLHRYRQPFEVVGDLLCVARVVMADLVDEEGGLAQLGDERLEV